MILLFWSYVVSTVVSGRSRRSTTLHILFYLSEQESTSLWRNYGMLYTVNHHKKPQQPSMHTYRCITAYSIHKYTHTPECMHTFWPNGAERSMIRNEDIVLHFYLKVTFLIYLSTIYTYFISSCTKTHIQSKYQ